MAGLNIELLDDGTMDTVVAVNCMRMGCGYREEIRWSSERFDRGPDGILTQKGWEQLEEDVIMSEGHDCQERTVITCSGCGFDHPRGHEATIREEDKL